MKIEPIKIYRSLFTQVWKWVLWPYILLELIRILIILVILIVGLVILKDKIDLGLVIAITIAYGFTLCKKTFCFCHRHPVVHIIFTVFLLYMWTCVISLYQIINIINTQNYKSLYGDDPLTDWSYNNDKASSLTDNKSLEVENVSFFSSSDFSQYSPIKVK